MQIRRVWAMPTSATFSCAPIGALVRRYLRQSTVSVDPFARNKRWATHTNDLNPDTAAEHHHDAIEFLKLMAHQGVKADLLIFDPPYSRGQISECYKAAGITPEMKHTQNSRLYAECRNEAMALLADDAIVISCGWNSAGMGIARGFEIVEILMVCHGGARNDTLVTVERRIASQQMKLSKEGE